MKTVALLSGGKDSTWNLVHCRAQGHDIVALATLSPPAGKEEIDSYLYQTVGQDGIDYIAHALQLPLYRQIISGKAVDQDLQYIASRTGDETEDLYDLLQRVLRLHPDVEGVAAGAILSTYQRIRIEHVCARLGLTCLAYLWQRDQFELLREMKEAGMNSILIKVAGAGLTTRHLGQNVASDEMMAVLEQLFQHSRFGLHPCGEGGEYETFTLDCPLFKHRIELYVRPQLIYDRNKNSCRLDSEVVHLSAPDGDRFSTVAYLRIKSVKLMPKGTTNSLVRSIEPPLLDAESQAMETVIQAVGQTTSAEPPVAEILSQHEASSSPPGSSSRGDWHAFGGITGFGGPAVQLSTDTGYSITEEVMAAFSNLAALLSRRSLTFSHLAHIDFLLAHMTDFATANAAYIQHFPHGSPPTRATVAVGLSSGCRVEIHAVACSASDRKPLHVQSLSYWAPANIGPYSQAIAVAGRHFVAGQIGLMPASLALPSELPRQLTLSAQHVRRIIGVTAPSARMDSCICWIAEGEWEQRLLHARAAWKAWNVKAPVLFVEARELPRGALVEWQCTFVDHTSITSATIVSDLADLATSKTKPIDVRAFCAPDSGMNTGAWPERKSAMAMASMIYGRLRSTMGENVVTSLVQAGHLATSGCDNLSLAYAVLSG